jgi:rhodanese-related sulfurtransferase
LKENRNIRKLPSLFILLAGLLACSCADGNNGKPANPNADAQQNQTEASFVDLSADSAFALIQRHAGNSDFVILDVRTPAEVQAGHIERAAVLDCRGEDFKHKLGELDKKTTYLIHCASGGRSGRALKMMQELGFKKVYHLTKGMREWQEKGLPVVQE